MRITDPYGTPAIMPGRTASVAEVGAAICFDINTYGFQELSPRIAVKGGRIAPTAHGG